LWTNHNGGRLAHFQPSTFPDREVIYRNDPELIFRPDGAAEALVQTKKDGKVRFVGLRGTKIPPFT
jgi:predicted oxidoreductase